MCTKATLFKKKEKNRQRVRAGPTSTLLLAVAPGPGQTCFCSRFYFLLIDGFTSLVFLVLPLCHHRWKPAGRCQRAQSRRSKDRAFQSHNQSQISTIDRRFVWTENGPHIIRYLWVISPLLRFSWKPVYRGFRPCWSRIRYWFFDLRRLNAPKPLRRLQKPWRGGQLTPG